MKTIRRNRYEDWFNSVCKGCVEDYSNCAFSKAVRSKQVTVQQLSVIQSGLCPFRTNGTIFWNGSSLSSVDISDRAPDEISHKLANIVEQLCQ